ncbi:MAG: hypothetical protein BWX70_02166 [Verrucomicrobia bacterium ADurb.Bin070]|nr:MAG: hypothetical protein BWX70_02166 [Verrucomicrobia bacterium ADurb.Bin070]
MCTVNLIHQYVGIKAELRKKVNRKDYCLRCPLSDRTARAAVAKAAVRL